MRRRLIPLCLLALLFGTGCKTTTRNDDGDPGTDDPWARFYVPSQPLRNHRFNKIQSEPQIRHVAPEQFDEAMAKAAAYYASKKMAPEDASPADHAAVMQLMFDSFLIRDTPETVAFLGESAYRSRAEASPDDRDQLRELAKSKGATFVVVAVKHAGKDSGYRMVPLQSTVTSGSGFATASNNLGGFAQGFATGSGVSIQEQAVPTEYDVWDHAAMYFRRLSAAEQAELASTR